MGRRLRRSQPCRVFYPADRNHDHTRAGWTTFSDVNFPQGIFCGGNGKLYFTEYSTNRIVQMDDISGTNLTTLGGTSAGSGEGQFHAPNSITYGSDGRIYVADTENNRIVRMDNISGEGWTAEGTFGTGTNQFKSPYGVSTR